MTAPLEDLVVIDLTHVLAGPFASMQMADLGARVIKVERPGIGDDTRQFPPFRGDVSAYFAAINHSKESIALDLHDEGDRTIFERLLERADVVLENYRPGVMERLGYGWDDLQARFPHLIYGAVSGFGHTGPDSQRPAYDMVVQARGGVMSITGETDREPVRVGASIGDIVAGMFLLQGVLAALYDRTRTGKGRKIDVAMLDAQLAIQEHAIAIANETGVSPGPLGARHPSITPFETFHCEDGLIVIAAGNDVLFARLCTALNLPLAEDERFHSNAARCQNHALLKRLIEAVTLGEGSGHWLDTFSKAGIPCAPIQNIGQAMQDPQVQARNMVVEVDAGTNLKPFAAAGNPIKMSDMKDTVLREPAPNLDQHRKKIMKWLEIFEKA